jgi:Abnormal spindle-like microcephaly-assoc'd, ASPM-SPD-2-Hydin
LLYSTYFGGSGSGTNIDGVEAIAIDASNNAYISGHTFSTANFPVFPTTAPQTTLKGPSDAFVAKLTLIPTLAVAPANLSFGNVLVGTTSGPQTVTLTNNTNSNIPFTSATVTGANAADFTPTPAASCVPNITPASPCTVSATFRPSVAGAETATLVLTDGDSTSPQNVSLTGSGTNTPPPDFTLSAAPTTLTVAQGAVGAPVTISVNPTNGFASAVALTCSGSPAKSSCVLSPTSITPPTTSTLTFTAHAMFVPLPISKPAPPLNFLRIVPLFLALMLIFLLRSTQRLRARLLTVSAIVICVMLAACSGGNNSNNDTVKGTYPLTVTGTSGALSHTTTVTVTVN